MSLPIYIDIDGTLTDSATEPAPANPRRIETVQRMIGRGVKVIIWSARGGDYAQKFVDENNLHGCIALGKPQVCIDDNPTIRPDLQIRPPTWLD